MKYVEIGKIEPGMVLHEPVLNEDGTIELLSEGTVLTERHIKLLKRLGFLSLKIDDGNGEGKELEANTIEEKIEYVKSKAEEAGATVDLDDLADDLKEIENQVYEPVITNIVNSNMVINVLTGEGNKPFDQAHEKMVEETKAVFNQIREGGSIDIELVKENIRESLPDMIRNNDVLMRLKQLQEGDDYTYQHSLRVSILAANIGKWLGYDKENLEELAEAALLFDIGKLKIPEFILKKDGRVTRDEYELIKKHAQLGYSVLLKTKGVSPNVKYAALQHHERMDGSGYPMKLKSGQIHEFAKIIMVCDVFDALIHDRPYHNKVSTFRAAEYLSWNSGVAFDSKVCYILLKNLSNYFAGKEVLMNTGEKGRIIFVDDNWPTKPVVQVGNEFIDLVKDRNYSIEELY